VSAGETTFASIPGNIDLQFLRYIRYFPWAVAIPGGLALITIACAFVFGFKQPWTGLAAIGLAAILAQLALLYRDGQTHFRHGCVNPAIVIRTNPLVIAVYSDLSTSDENFHPAVKVMRHPRLRSDQFQAGDRCATVSLYSGNFAKPKWKNFNPLLVNVATDDMEVVAISMARIPEDEWIILEDFIRRSASPIKCRLYPLDDITRSPKLSH
jgi:hypothetical protein